VKLMYSIVFPHGLVRGRKLAGEKCDHGGRYDLEAEAVYLVALNCVYWWSGDG
jgi:hypothetical protein